MTEGMVAKVSMTKERTIQVWDTMVAQYAVSQDYEQYCYFALY